MEKVPEPDAGLVVARIRKKRNGQLEKVWANAAERSLTEMEKGNASKAVKSLKMARGILIADS